MRVERDDYRGQLRRRETDFENRTKAEHSNTVRQLESRLETDDIVRTKAKEAEARSTAEADRLRHELASERISHEGELRERERAATSKFNIAMSTKDRMILKRDSKIEEANVKTLEAIEDKERVERELERAYAKNTERLNTIKNLCGRLGGRPLLCRTEAELALCTVGAASHARANMKSSVAEAIGSVGSGSEISVVALMTAIADGGYLELVWESELMWEMRMEWAHQIRDDLSLAWTAQLSSDLRDRLVISYDKMDELRFSLSHHRVGKQLRPRIWFNNPWNGDKLTFPQPIRPRSGVLGWARLIAAAQVRFGLTMDAKGRVAQRSYSKTVALQYERDKARKLLRPITKGEPLVTVIGADGTGVGKRSIMHVASSIAPSYRDGISVENEKNINTVATSITDDHWAGLNEVLCSNFYIGTGDILPPNSIAADVNGMLRTGLLPGTDVPVKVTGCFDLVAARGIRGCRGRGACHTESQTADRFNVPNITPQTTWAEAKKMLHEVPMLKNSEMRDDSHTPPADWDYSASAWKCRRKGCTVMFETHMQFCNARKQFLSAKADKSADGKKATSARAKTRTPSCTRRSKKSFARRAPISTWRILSSTRCTVCC